MWKHFCWRAHSRLISMVRTRVRARARAHTHTHTHTHTPHHTPHTHTQHTHTHHTHRQTHTYTHTQSYLPSIPAQWCNIISQSNTSKCLFFFLEKSESTFVIKYQTRLKRAGFDKRTSLPRHSSKEFYSTSQR